MSKRGKSLKIFLMDGVATGRWMCELSNWTGKAYKIPRTSYKKCIDRDELRNPSVYFLFGYDDENGKPLVYIGETEDAIQRLGDHIRSEKKNYWVEAIVFISKDDHLNKAHIKYLESRFYQIGKEAERYEIMNSNPPKKSSVSEAEESEMEEFIDNVKLVVSALGHKVFEPLVPVVEAEKKGIEEVASENLYIKNNKGLSAAADFVLGYSASGPKVWKNSNGKSLKEINEE